MQNSIFLLHLRSIDVLRRHLWQPPNYISSWFTLTHQLKFAVNRPVSFGPPISVSSSPTQITVRREKSELRMSLIIIECQGWPRSKPCVAIRQGHPWIVFSRNIPMTSGVATRHFFSPGDFVWLYYYYCSNSAPCVVFLVTWQGYDTARGTPNDSLFREWLLLNTYVVIFTTVIGVQIIFCPCISCNFWFLFLELQKSSKNKLRVRKITNLS